MNLTLEIMTDTFIDSGEKVTSLDYSITNNKCNFYDFEAFLSYIERNSPKSIEEIGQFIKKKITHNRIETDFEEVCSKIGVDSSQFLLHSLPLVSYQNNVDKLSEISIFSNDGAYNFYLPGSSLKGVIRTVFLNSKLKNENINSSFMKKKINDTNKEIKDDAIFKDLIFRDCYFSLDNLEVVSVQRWMKSGGFRDKKMNISSMGFYTTLKRGTKLNLEVENLNFNSDFISKCNEYTTNYINYYIKRIEEYLLKQDGVEDYNEEHLFNGENELKLLQNLRNIKANIEKNGDIVAYLVIGKETKFFSKVPPTLLSTNTKVDSYLSFRENMSKKKSNFGGGSTFPFYSNGLPFGFIKLKKDE